MPSDEPLWRFVGPVAVEPEPTAVKLEGMRHLVYHDRRVRCLV
jgi:hypothetical protein